MMFVHSQNVLAERSPTFAVRLLLRASDRPCADAALSALLRPRQGLCRGDGHRRDARDVPHARVLAHRHTRVRFRCLACRFATLTLPQDELADRPPDAVRHAPRCSRRARTMPAARLVLRRAGASVLVRIYPYTARSQAPESAGIARLVFHVNVTKLYANTFCESTTLSSPCHRSSPYSLDVTSLRLAPRRR